MQVWTKQVHLCVDFFQLTHVVQTRVVQGSAGGWESKYMEDLGYMWIFDWAGSWCQPPRYSRVNCNCLVPLPLINLISVFSVQSLLSRFPPADTN